MAAMPTAAKASFNSNKLTSLTFMPTLSSAFKMARLLLKRVPKQLEEELAVEGKRMTSDAIASLGKVVGDTAAQIDEKLGPQYGDYARKASRTLAETSAKLEAKIDKWAERDWGKKDVKVRAGGGAIYFVGFVGAAIYYVSHATDFWMGALGLLKSMVWPAFLVYEALNKLGA